jgi:hypothetical protein
MQVDKPLDLFLGNAGTAMRPLTAVLCAGQGEVGLAMVPSDVATGCSPFVMPQMDEGQLDQAYVIGGIGCRSSTNHAIVVGRQLLPRM